MGIVSEFLEVGGFALRYTVLKISDLFVAPPVVVYALLETLFRPPGGFAQSA
jgi:hypothetical protein